MSEENITLDQFLASWTQDGQQMKQTFLAFKDLLSLPGVSFDFKARPGISYSLRAKHEAQKEPLFVLIDVIDDDPDERWLSVCFYAKMTTDPEDLADFVPGGLLGEDAHCFNLDTNDPELKAYVADRLLEASLKARGE